MVIEKNGKTYIVTESNDAWKVKRDDRKVSVAFDVSKELCATEESLREYVQANNDLF